jgi:hypothetical protein
MQMLQQPDKITILYNEDHEVRWVRMNQPHPAQVTPSWHGDSVGHYQGGTLVIDTVGVKTDRPFAMIDLFGTPYTKALHVVERYSLLDYEVELKHFKHFIRDVRGPWLRISSLSPRSNAPFAAVKLTVTRDGRSRSLDVPVTDISGQT